VADLVKENIKLSKTKYWVECFLGRLPIKKRWFFSHPFSSDDEAEE